MNAFRLKNYYKTSSSIVVFWYPYSIQSMFPGKLFCNVHHSLINKNTTPQLATPIYVMKTYNISLFLCCNGSWTTIFLSQMNTSMHQRLSNFIAIQSVHVWFVVGGDQSRILRLFSYSTTSGVTWFSSLIVVLQIRTVWWCDYTTPPPWMALTRGCWSGKRCETWSSSGMSIVWISLSWVSLMRCVSYHLSMLQISPLASIDIFSQGHCSICFFHALCKLIVELGSYLWIYRWIS